MSEQSVLRSAGRIFLPLAVASVLTYLFIALEPALRYLGFDVSPDRLLTIERVLGTLIGLALAWLLCRLIDEFFWSVVRRRTGQMPPRLLVALFRVIVAMVAIGLIVAYVFEQPLTGMLVSSGVVGIVLGFALQRTISDFFSGIALNAERSFRVGDWIQVGDQAGRVTEINWRATHMVRLDHVLVIVPNSHIAEQPILNYSLPHRWFRAEIPIELEYSVPIADAERVLLAGIRAASGVLDRPSPDVKAAEFGNDGVVYRLRFYVASYGDMIEVIDQVMISVGKHIWQAGMRVPHPKRDVFHAPMPARDIDRKRDRATLLHRIDLFSALDLDAVTRLADGLVEQEYKAGDRVVRQGEPGSTLYVVVEGLLEIRFDDGQTTRSVGKVEAGEFFGELSLLTGEPRSATVVAATDSVLYALDRQVLAPLLAETPELAETLSKALAARRALRQTASASSNEETPAARRSTASDFLRRIQGLFKIGDGH